MMINATLMKRLIVLTVIFSSQLVYSANIESRVFNFEINPTGSSEKKSGYAARSAMYGSSVKLVSQSQAYERPPRQRNPQVSKYDLVVVGYDQNGTEISREIVVNPSLVRHEVFDVKTGVIKGAEDTQINASFGVMLPQDERLFSLEVFKPYWTGAEFKLDSKGVFYVN